MLWLEMAVIVGIVLAKRLRMSRTLIAYILRWPVRRLLRVAKGYLADISNDQPLHTWSQWRSLR